LKTILQILKFCIKNYIFKLDCLIIFIHNDKNVFQIDGQTKMEVNIVMDGLMNKLMMYYKFPV